MHILKITYKIFLFFLISIIIIILGLYLYAFFSKPVDLKILSSYTLYDSSNNLVEESTSNKKWISISDISPNLINAVVSVEDKNFYEHDGFDYLRIIKALYNNIKNKRVIEGASTISQQYIKNAYLDFDQTWSRKIKEALMTLNLEVHYSKDEILEAYLNTINYGKGNYGINSAAEFYFNKKASDLSLEEAIILAGIPKNPNNYNPVNNYENAIKRARVVALSMYNNGYLTTDEYNSLFKEKIEIYGKNNEEDLLMLPYFEDAVLQELKEIPGITSEMINSGKLKVYTTLNLESQKSLEQNIKKNIILEESQVASIIVNPQTGAIEALTGGMNYLESQYNRALSSKRQVGSTMKPFLYYAALKNGMTSASTFLSQYTTFNLSGNITYSPKNYNNIYPNYEITMAAAISYSDNIYAVKTNLFLGTEELVTTARLCGITGKLNPVASLALGTSEINIMDFAKGYTTFASGGYKRDLYTISKITDEKGNIIYEKEVTNNLVLNPNYVYILNDLLTTTTDSTFKDYNTPTEISVANKLSQKYAIKTGTTDTDHWEVGYNKDKLVIIWTGYDDNRNIDTSLILSSKNAWADIMESVVNKENDNWYEMPENVVGLALHAITGSFTYDSSKAHIFYFVKGSEPLN